MHFIEKDDSSEKSMDIFYWRNMSRHIYYSSEEDPLDLKRNLVGNPCTEFSNTFLDMNVEH